MILNTKPVIYIEGEPDYKLPVNSPPLRSTGSFQAVSRILAHSFLHGGFSIHGLSKAVKHYFASTKVRFIVGSSTLGTQGCARFLFAYAN